MVEEGVRKSAVLHNGHFANAVVWAHWMDDGSIVVEKDFSSRLSFVRNTVGRFLVRREVRFLRELEPIGVVPSGARRVGPFSMVEDYCRGVTLRQMISFVTGFAEQDGIGESPEELRDLWRQPDVSFFENLEREIKKVHRMGIVHLDLHNARNLIRMPGDRCVVIDWQSALRTTGILRPFRRYLEAIDLAGIYKHWEKILPETLDDERRRILGWEGRVRKLWPFRGLKIDAPVERGGKEPPAPAGD